MITRLSFYDDYELKIQLWDHNDIYGEVNYWKFKVLSEADNYKLELGKLKTRDDFKHMLVRTADDSLSGVSGRKFSTKDNDNDAAKYKNIAKKYKSAGWLKRLAHVEQNLFGSNLNTVQTKRENMGVTWNSFRGSRYSLKQAIMAIRPIEHYQYGS